MSLRSSSTPVNELLEVQLKREQREAERARYQAINNRAQLMAAGKEAATEHGRQMLLANAEKVTVALGLLLEELLANPAKAGKHLSCWPLLLLVNRGPRSVALVALSALLDTISQTQPERVVANAIGVAVEREVRALRIEAGKSAALLRLVRRRLGRTRLADPKVLRALEVDDSRWEPPQRKEIGLLLLDVIAANTDLVTLRVPRGRRARVVEPSDATRRLIRETPPQRVRPRALAQLVQPADWEGMHSSNHREPLVRSRAGHDLSYLTPEVLKPALKVVNTLQQQQLQIDPWMVQVQRQAWDADIPGLFPVRRVPTHPGGNRERVRIETSLQHCEELAGHPVWNSYCLDFRGRVYTANRYATHQGPDASKACVQFGRGEQCSVEAFEWLLKAAASHWGLRSSWRERLRWGQIHISDMVMAGQAPLERVSWWREAKEPWQFLQLCRAIQQQIADPSSPCMVPVRFDQTCSGVGIAAALMRDRKLARLTNICGTTRQDIYGAIAEKLAVVLERELHAGPPWHSRWAEFWLGLGVDRTITKAPVMTTCYGSQYLGHVEQLIEVLEERRARLPVKEWERGYVAPAQYLAKRLQQVLMDEMTSCLRLRAWLTATCRAVVRKERKLRWTGPMGFPVQLGRIHDQRRVVNSLTRGSRRWRAATDAVTAEGLSAMSTNRSITANMIHSFDAALCHAVICTAADHGVELLTNHDCFAATPTNAGWLHHTLLDQLAATYREDWLAEVAEQIRCDNKDLQISPPPMVGDLCPGEIGQNTMVFS